MFRCLVFLKILHRLPLFSFIFFCQSDIFVFRNKVKRSLWKHIYPFILPTGSVLVELARQTKKDESSASILILGGKFTEDFVESVLIPSMYCWALKKNRKKSEAVNVREYMKRFFKKLLFTDAAGSACLLRLQQAFGEWRGRKAEGEAEPLVSINKHNSQDWTLRPPSREHLLWFVNAVEVRAGAPSVTVISAPLQYQIYTVCTNEMRSAPCWECYNKKKIK